MDLCYTNSKNKTFAWDIAGEQLFQNVLYKNGNIIYYPTKDENGDIEFGGEKFSLQSKLIGGEYDVDIE